MPRNNSRLTPEQKFAALAWQAACEKLEHFLCATPGYPEMTLEEVIQMMERAESALLDLRRVFEGRSAAVPTQ